MKKFINSLGGKISIWLVIIIILMMIIKRVSFSFRGLTARINGSISSLFESDESKAENKRVQDAQTRIAEQTKNTRKLSDAELQIISDNLFYAILDGFFEDEELAISELRKITTQGDWYKLCELFGVRKAHWFGSSYTLSQAIIEYIHGNDLKEIQDILLKISITL